MYVATLAFLSVCCETHDGYHDVLWRRRVALLSVQYFSGEGQLEFRVFLFVPRRVPPDLFAYTHQRHYIKLHFLRRFHCG